MSESFPAKLRLHQSNLLRASARATESDGHTGPQSLFFLLARHASTNALQLLRPDFLLTVGRTANFGKLESGIEGISRGACRMFLTNAPFRENYATG
jgi:hypothetical protein